jgi:hypothetical protein
MIALLRNDFRRCLIRGTAPDSGSKSRKQCNRLEPAKQEYLSPDAGFPAKAFEPSPAYFFGNPLPGIPLQDSNLIVSDLNGEQVKARIRNHWIKVYTTGQNP